MFLQAPKGHPWVTTLTTPSLLNDPYVLQPCLQIMDAKASYLRSVWFAFKTTFCVIFFIGVDLTDSGCNYSTITLLKERISSNFVQLSANLQKNPEIISSRCPKIVLIFEKSAKSYFKTEF